MTPKQARFVDEYLIDFNATQAAIRAGYSKVTAQQQGSRLLSNVVVSAEIAKRRGSMQSSAIMSATEVLAELSKIGRASMRHYMKATPAGDPYLDFSDLTDDQAAALIECTVEDFTDGRGADARDVKRVKFRLASKNDALAQLAKYHGIASGDVPIKLDLPPIKSAADVADASAVVLAKLSAGTIAPDLAAKLMQVLEHRRRAIETVELEARVSAIEQQQGAQK